MTLGSERREGKYLGRMRVLRGRVISIQRILQIMLQIGPSVAANGFNRIENNGTSKRNGDGVLLLLVGSVVEQEEAGFGAAPAPAACVGPTTATTNPGAAAFLLLEYSALMATG